MKLKSTNDLNSSFYSTRRLVDFQKSKIHLNLNCTYTKMSKMVIQMVRSMSFVDLNFSKRKKRTKKLTSLN